MKKYYIKNKRGFANTYLIVYTETKIQDEKAEKEGYERISKIEAEKLCKAEKDRRKYNPMSAGYASVKIKSIDEVDYII